MTGSKFSRRGAIALPLLWLFGCDTPDTGANATGGQPQSDTPVTTVTVMAFNVQNLFDNHDDPGKDDKAYLPIGAKQNPAHISACNEIEFESWRNECLHVDWSDAAVDQKLTVLAGTIRHANNGRGPDIIALQEVENRSILERLRTEQLQGLGYGPAILIEGTDARGIDVAFLSRLPLATEPRLHALPFPDFPDREGDTRGVLQADFETPNGRILTAYSVHFPAPFHPTAMRVAAYEQLTALLQELPADRTAVAAGDFNTTVREDRVEKLLDRYARPHWEIAHDAGCDGCRGTHHSSYNDSWSFLDMILIAKPRSKKATVRMRGNSVRIVSGAPGQLKADGTPQRYLSLEGIGVSDHLPLMVSLEIT